jgi:tetratricopeptide (TPR) repeat protein
LSGILRRLAGALRGPGRDANAQSSAQRSSVEERLREGSRLQNAGDAQGAAEIYRQILELDSGNAEANYRLGEISHAEGDIAGATVLFERAAECDPDQARHHYALGCMLEATAQPARAAASYRSALALDAGHAAAHINLGRILQHFGELATYSGEDRAGLSQTPSDNGEASASRSPAEIRDLGRAWLEEAFGHFQTAARIAPESAMIQLNLGFCLAARQQFAEALEIYQRALAVDPEFADAHVNRALVLLAQGRFAEAWAEYEWRWRRTDVPAKLKFDQPEWDGSPPERQTLLLYTEQGFGDAIQFVRYAPLLASRGAKIILLTHPGLKGLFETVPGVSGVVGHGEPLPAFDRHFPLLSLPHALGTALDSIPAEVPYLAANPILAEKWRVKLAGTDRTGGGAMKIGLVWASEPRNRIAPMKSVKLDQFEALRPVDGVKFYSLQIGEAAGQLREPSAPMAITDLTESIDDFADTAAIVANLDLVISIDTAVAHLAGAMGRPVWTLIQFAPDWRWYPLAETSLWYPSMRLFRQPSPGDWSSVIARVAGELNALASRRA